MSPATKTGADDHDRLIDLAHLSSAVAHYLINAFSATVSNSELIRSPMSRATDAKEQGALASSIIDTALNASNVARKLIDRARSEVAFELDAQIGEPQTVDLNQLIEELVESEKRSGEAGIDWRWNPGTIAPIPGDRHQLRMMLARIVQNAKEALPGRSGTIEFSTHTDSRDWVIVTIHDSGCGMSQEVQRRAGEPFFTTKEDHAGVGLTIAQVIWRRHRGACSIESSPGAGTTAEITSDPARLRRATKVVLPGVGAFAQAMAELNSTGLGEAFCEAVRAGKPCLGVCLGLQLLFDASHEDGEHKGLGLLKGRVVRFAARPGLKIPHMGWNTLRVRKPVPLLAGLGPDISVYFVHSYHAVPEDREHVAAEADYSGAFPAIVWHENLMACQFHPEKSQSVGLAMYANFAALD